MIKDLRSQTREKELTQRLVTTNPRIGGRTEKMELPELRSHRNQVETNQGIPVQGKVGTGREKLLGLGAMKEIQLLLETLNKTERGGGVLLLLPSSGFLYQCLQLFSHAWKPVDKEVWSMWFLDQERARNGTESE